MQGQDVQKVIDALGEQCLDVLTEFLSRSDKFDHLVTYVRDQQFPSLKDGIHTQSLHDEITASVWHNMYEQVLNRTVGGSK